MKTYELRRGFGDCSFGSGISVEREFDTREEAIAAFDALGEYAGCKSAWFTEANCGFGRRHVPNDYIVAVCEVEYDEDGEFVDEDDVAIKSYGYDSAIAEYGSLDDAPFGLKHKSMVGMGW